MDLHFYIFSAAAIFSCLGSRMLNEYFSAVDFLVLKPVILLTLFAMGVLLTDLLLEPRYKYFNAITALVGVGFACLQLWMIQGQMREAGVNAIGAFRCALILVSFALSFILIY